jgi:hypothetical protein
MKNKKLLLFGLGLAIAGGSYMVVPRALSSGEKNLTHTSEEYEEGEEEDFNGALEFLFNMKKNADGKVEVEEVLRSRESAQAAMARPAGRAVPIQWSEMGPSNVGGRTRAILFDKNDPNVMYAGGVAGGLWRTVNGGQSWSKVFDKLDNIAVSAIAQAPNGDLYVGTGEGLYSQYGIGAGGMLGAGIYKSTDNGATWSVLPSTVPSNTNSTSVAWAAVNELAINQTTGRIFAATNKGLQISDDGGATWVGAFTLGAFTKDVDVASDGTVITNISSSVYMSPDGTPGTYVLISKEGMGAVDSLPKNQARYESTFSPSDPNYIYCSVAGTNQALKGIYRSTNKGQTWSLIGPGGSTTFNPLGSQGEYANAIAVNPTNKDEIIVGGLDLYIWSTTTTWTKLSRWYTYSADPKYVHADIHELRYHPTNGNTFYVGCDGGVFRTLDHGVNFYNRNQGYNVTQFYAVSTGVLGDVLGGAQDNGSQYIPTFGTGSQIAYEVSGGDGGQTEMSYLNPEATFQTVYYGQLTRRPTRTSGFGNEFYSARLANLTVGGAGVGSPGFANFVTPIRLWESKNDTMSTDSVNFTADRDYLAGETIYPKSRTNSVLYSVVTSVNIDSGMTVKVRDLVQSRFVLGINGSVWMTKGALDFSSNPGWARIASSTVLKPSAFSGTVQCFEFTKDGNHVFVGTDNGKIYRISNLNSMNNNDTLTGEIGNAKCNITCTLIGGNGSRVVTSLASDPQNPNNLIATFGNYGNTNYVYRHTNAINQAISGTMASWTVLTGTTTPLPTTIAYASVIDYLTGTVIIGNEHGVWSAEDGLTSTDPTWVNQNTNSFPAVPVFMLRQQTHSDYNVLNTGVIYAATHGRGIWKTNTFVGIRDNAPAVSTAVSMTVYPNPVVSTATLSFTSKNKGEATVRVYSLNGNLVFERKQNVQAGSNSMNIEASELANGTYIVKVSGVTEGTSKFVVIK